MTPLKDLRIAQTLNLRLRKFTYIIASPAAVPATRLFEAELGHDGSEASAIGILLEVADGADLGGDLCQGEEFRSCLLEAGGGVAEGDELLLVGLDHETLDMGLERLDVVEVEPVVESAAQQVERLCEHAVVGHAVGEWRVDGLDVEGQPSAVAGLVGEELLLVARCGVTGHSDALLLVATEGCAHVDVRGGDHRLDLVQLPVGQFVELVDVDEPVFSGAQLLVLVQPLDVDVVGGVSLQFWGQESVDPGGVLVFF